MINEVCFVMPNMSGGGAQRVISVISNYFCMNGIRTTILLTNQCVLEYDINENILIDDVCAKNKYHWTKMISHIRHRMKENPNEAYVSFLDNQNMFTVIAAMGLKNRVIISQRNDPNKAYKSSILRLIQKFIYILADRTVFQTTEARDYYPRLARKHSTIIMNPLMGSLPQRYDGKRSNRIVTVCRLNKQKNLWMAIDAFEIFATKHPDYVFEIYGKGELEEELKCYVAEKHLSDRILFKGFCNNVHEQIRDAKALIISSDFEGLSNSMIESIAIGVPTISTDCPIGGARMVIEDGVNGYMVPVGDSIVMADRMDLIVSNDELAAQLSCNGEKLKETLKPEKICEEWMKLLE